MKINFLLGSLMFRKKKTGVHLYYYNLLLRYAKEYTDNYCISVYDCKSNVRPYIKKDFYGHVKFSSKFVRILLYFIPVELIFGKSDVYVCDGLSPLTIFESKKIFVIHDLMVYLYPENYSFIKRCYLKYFFRHIHKADLVIAVSRQTQNDIVRLLHYPEEKIRVVYNGVEKTTETQNNIKLSIDAKKKYLFYIGDFRKNKNVINALKAYEMYISNTSDDILFYIAGNRKGHEYEILKKYILEKGLENKVIFLGYITEDEKALLFKNANAFIFVSLYEGFGVPIIEAMSYGIPVITSNCSSMKEIACENSALLVNPQNVVEIADAIEKVQDVKVRQRLVYNGYRIASKFTWDNAYEQFRNVINECKM